MNTVDLSELVYVKDISSWDSGGGISLDIVELKDGKVLGITEESVVLYESMEALEEGAAVDNATIFL